MGFETQINSGLANAAAKQHGAARQAQTMNKRQAEELETTKSDASRLTAQDVSDMANPVVDEYVQALAEQDEVSKAKKKYSPTVESLKERLESALESKYDNAHNMMAEAFYGLQVSTSQAMLGMLGADPADLEAIRRKAYEGAKQKVHAGFERLARAYAEHAIYAS